MDCKKHQAACTCVADQEAFKNMNSIGRRNNTTEQPAKGMELACGYQGCNFGFVTVTDHAECLLQIQKHQFMRGHSTEPPQLSIPAAIVEAGRLIAAAISELANTVSGESDADMTTDELMQPMDFDPEAQEIERVKRLQRGEATAKQDDAEQGY